MSTTIDYLYKARREMATGHDDTNAREKEWIAGFSFAAGSLVTGVMILLMTLAP